MNYLHLLQLSIIDDALLHIQQPSQRTYNQKLRESHELRTLVAFLAKRLWPIFGRMRVLIFLVISIVGILHSVIVDAAKGKSAVAVPRKSKGNPMSRTVFGSMFSRAFREMKVTFCSELEALTLQVQNLS